MAGYANRIVTLNFPELSEDQDKDPIRVVLRNPNLEPPQALIPKGDIEIIDGRPVDPQAALLSGAEVIAKLIIGWRVYDSTASITLNENLEPVGDQPLLPQQFTAENVAKLPGVIQNRIAELIQEALNPR